MRVETVQYDDPPPQVIQWARWAGVGLLFYAALMAFDRLDLATARNGTLWILPILILPYVASGCALLFSDERLERTESRVPQWVAAVLILAAGAVVIRTLTAAEPLLGPVYPNGFWGAVRLATSTGLPLALLLLLLSSIGGRYDRPLALLAVGVGSLLLAGAVAVAIRDLNNVASPGVWHVIRALVPGASFAFALVVAGLHAVDERVGRKVALAFVALLSLAALAAAMRSLDSDTLGYPWWSTGIAVSVRWAQIVLVLAFAGVLARRHAYAAASAGLLATLVFVAAYVAEFGSDLRGLGLFWVSTLNLVQVGSMLLLALVTVEVSRLPEASGASSPPAPLLARKGSD
jgi:hypothetical protein